MQGFQGWMDRLHKIVLKEDLSTGGITAIKSGADQKNQN